MAINGQETITEIVTEETKDLDFGFEAEYVENEYTTISGKEQKNLSNATGYGIMDLEVGNIVTGYPEVTIFENNEKDLAGDYVRNYQSARVRVIDHDEYVDLYANIPRKDETGFIERLSKFQNFYRTGFDLVFSFMRWINEGLVLTDDGEEKNKINKVNIVNVCKKIDSMGYVKIKIIPGADEEYDSWIILDMKEKV